MTRYVLTDEQEAFYRRSPRLITPSKPQPWEGRYDEGERFSQKQLGALEEAGTDPAAADVLEVEVAGDPRRVYLGSHNRPFGTEIVYFHRRIPCPVIGRHGDRVKVIAPDGSTKLAYPNGQLTRRRAA